jgi:putative hydrolase of the HAD superfamily
MTRKRKGRPVSERARTVAGLQAVLFDLWDTLADFDFAGAQALERKIAGRLGMEAERFHELWWANRDAHFTGPIADSLLAIGVPATTLPELLALRLEFFRHTLLPRAGALETLRAVRARGLRLGLVSQCTEEVPALWERTPFAELFDATIFSCAVGVDKPDRRIYLLACEQLDVLPARCLFVGDGGNNELDGAQRLGMNAVLLERRDRAAEPPPRWEGPRITALSNVLDLI